jgi:DNA gyrase inhibitor GyrI
MQIEIRDVPQQQVAYVSLHGVSLDTIAEAFHTGISRMWAAAGVQGAISGPCFGRYNCWGEGGGDLDVGFVVRGKVNAPGVENDVLGGCSCAVALHIGPYDGLKASWEAAYQWLGENGYIENGAPWEMYLDDPEVTPPHRLRTEICIPVCPL